MKKKPNLPLIIVIIGASLLISGSLIFLGTQMQSRSVVADDSGDLSATIRQGIEDYIQEKQEGATKPQVVQGDYTDDDPYLGDADAPITIVEWSDYQCPFCRRFYNDTLPELKAKYIDTGKAKLVYRDFPLSFHKDATPAAAAAECAREQKGDDIYFAYHDLIFEGQNELGQGTVNIPEESLKQYAGELGLNTNEFNECLASNKYAAEIQKDFADGQSAGVSGTPAFLINGQMLSGAQPFSSFEQVIEALLQ